MSEPVRYQEAEGLLGCLFFRGHRGAVVLLPPWAVLKDAPDVRRDFLAVLCVKHRSINEIAIEAHRNYIARETKGFTWKKITSGLCFSTRAPMARILL